MPRLGSVLKRKTDFELHAKKFKTNIASRGLGQGHARSILVGLDLETQFFYEDISSFGEFFWKIHTDLIMTSGGMQCLCRILVHTITSVVLKYR